MNENDLSHIELGRPSERLSKKAQQLLAQLCVQHPSEGIVFELSAKLLDKEPLQKAQKLQKAYRAYTQVRQCYISTKLRIIFMIIFLSIESSGAKHVDKNT